VLPSIFKFHFVLLIILLTSAICSNYVQIKVCDNIFGMLTPILIFGNQPNP
jgi:hypothetical protein